MCLCLWMHLCSTYTTYRILFYLAASYLLVLSFTLLGILLEGDNGFWQIPFAIGVFLVVFLEAVILFFILHKMNSFTLIIYTQVFWALGIVITVYLATNIAIKATPWKYNLLLSLHIGGYLIILAILYSYIYYLLSQSEVV